MTRRRSAFKPTSFRPFTKRIFGFDIETYDRNTKITCASIVGKVDGVIYQRYFESSGGRDVKQEIITELKTNPIFRNSVIFATNLDFDFFGTFFTSSERAKFIPKRRGSKVLSMKTYFLPDGEWSFFRTNPLTKSKKQRPSLEFRDSLNYAQISVEQMGKIVGFEKLPTPDFIVDKEVWTKPKTVDEWEAMKRYNINDSWVTYKFMVYLFEGYQQLGATVKLTQASTSMSLFKNRFLDFDVLPADKDRLLDIFKAYYGGRTETFKRGHFKNAKYYDYNSLYPSVMAQMEFPDPRSMRYSRRDVQNYIIHKDGVSEVTIEIPYMKIPPLPVKLDNKGSKKILFPIGEHRGWWSHIELRHALDCGCTIKKVHHSIYYVFNMRPFKGFVDTLYTLRKKYKKEKPYNAMEYVTKILMNSLYGKFGEKFEGQKETYDVNSVTKDMLNNSICVEYIGEKKEWIDITTEQQPMAHCIPIWAVYVSAYGRIKMHKTLMQHPDAIYCDTDSIITHDTLPTSDDLGDLKLEDNVTDGWSVRPKMYALIDEENKEPYIKVKGLRIGLMSLERFKGLEEDPVVYFKRPARFKEAIRRGDIVPNETITAHKTLGLEDDKRDWKGQKFSFNDFQDSDPLVVRGGEIVREASQGRKLESQEETNDK